MPSGFRLLAYAIAAVLLLAVFYNFIAPFFFPTANAAAEIGESLASAEAGLGMGFGKRLAIRGETGFQGISFDTRTRSVVFSCNSAELCCPKGTGDENCSTGIEWDDRKILFKEALTVEATARCEEQAGLYACRVYLGDKPAQVEISAVEAKQLFDLGRGMPRLGVVVENSGEKEILQGAVEVRVFQLYLIDGEEQKTLIASASKTRELLSTGPENRESLNPGESKRIEVELQLAAGGEYKAEVTASGLDAGYDSSAVYFDAVGEVGSCAASGCDSPRLAGGECTAKCHCSGCMLYGECLQKLLEAGSTALGLPEEVDLGSAESQVLESNAVEFVLQERLC